MERKLVLDIKQAKVAHFPKIPSKDDNVYWREPEVVDASGFEALRLTFAITRTQLLEFGAEFPAHVIDGWTGRTP